MEATTQGATAVRHYVTELTSAAFYGANVDVFPADDDDRRTSSSDLAGNEDYAKGGNTDRQTDDRDRLNKSTESTDASDRGEVEVMDAAKANDERPVKSDIISGWFNEWIDYSCGGHAMCLKVDEVLFHQQSKYQDILVFKSSTYGNVMVLDGIINCTERDEFAYQEMITHLALCSHPNPQTVLIIGGGDGGVAREVAKHDGVKRIVQCEIDAMVVEVCKKYLPSMAQGFSGERVELVIGDGFAFIEQHKNEFDVIITDSSDPEGPAETLFGTEYYRRMYKALKPNGLLISQGQTMWIQKDMELTAPLLNELRQLFAVVSYSYTYIPTYTMGQIGFVMASKDPETNFKEPLLVFTEEQSAKMKLRYYNADVHRSSFVLPQFVRKILPV